VSTYRHSPLDMRRPRRFRQRPVQPRPTLIVTPDLIRGLPCSFWWTKEGGSRLKAGMTDEGR